MRIGCLVAIFVCSLKIAALYGLEYDYKTFDVQPQPIQFLSQPDDHYTVPRADITFVCSVTSFNGFPNITWLFNNTVIKTGSHYNISNDGHTTCTLIIRNVSTDDHGDYHCCISEWNTVIRSRSGRLYVMNDGNISNYNDENIWSYNIKVAYKSTVVLPCNLKLNTKPIWIQNWSKLNSKTLFIDESGNLVLVNVSEDHSGHYQCQVNESGTIRNGSSYELTVQSPMGSLDHDPGKPSSQNLLIIPDHCEQSPHNQTVTLQCPVTGYPSPVISWYLNGELVNLTDYNVTDNVGNNTWIIEGGDPCRLIGYWQCFATNEAGTVHNEIRVLPYGWMSPPGRPTLKVADLSEDLTNYLISVHVNVTWSPPQYLGGLNASDIYYQLHATGYDINTTETYSVLFYDEVNFSVRKKSLDVSIAVHYNGSTTDTLYIPTNIIQKKRYDNFLCDAVEFKPPQIFTQSENGTFYVNWSLPDQQLSVAYIDHLRYGWLLSGYCTNNGIIMNESVLKDLTYTYDYATIPVSEGMSCTYEIRPNYDGCDCGTSCQGSFTCALNVSPTATTSTTFISSGATSMGIDLVYNTATHSPSVLMEPKSITITITTTTLSTLNKNPTAVTTHSTSNGSSTISSSFPTSSSGSGSTSSTTLFIIIGVLSVLLIGSIIFSTAVLYIQRWKRCKSTGKYEGFQE